MAPNTTDIWSENYTDANFSAYCRVKNMSSMFSILSGAFVALATFGVSGNLFLLLILPKASLLHKNVRIMMANMTAAALVLCIFSGGRGVYNLLITFHLVDFSTPMSPFKCALIEIVATTSAFLTVLCIFGIGAERLYATWKRASSDMRSDWLPKMVIGLWTAAAATTFIQAVTAGRSATLCYCHTILSFHEVVLFFTCAGYFCVEIPALIMYCIVRRWNRTRLGSFGANLSERFQTWNTIRATEMLLASVIIHGVCLSIVEIGSYLAHLFYFTHSSLYEVDITSLNVLHAITFFMNFHAATHPFISIWRCDHLRKHAKRHIDAIFSRRSRRNDATGAAVAVAEIGHKLTNGYFEPMHTTSFAERPPFERPPRVPDKARQRMGVPTRQRTMRQNGPAYQVFQITPEQSAALLQRFWR